MDPAAVSGPRDRKFSLRALLVCTAIVAYTLAMLRAVGPAATVLNPLSYLYFVLFSPQDRPSGETIVRIVTLLAVGSMGLYVVFPSLFR